MRYLSTRDPSPQASPSLAFDDVLLAGLARDGGLYLPESWPLWTPGEFRSLAGAPYDEVAAAVLAPFVDGAIADEDLRRICREAYLPFGHEAKAPLRQLGPELWLLELFHGPTIAFKDYALQLLGRLVDHVLAARGERLTIVGATSGDTGSAAIEAFRDREAVDVVILYPHGRVSEVQRRQMTTVASPNVHTLAIEGSFDDCQDMLKAMFADDGFRSIVRLSAANSINFARVVAQTAYYVAAAVALGSPDRPVRFAVPSGNFGNIFAAYVARRMGMPVSRLVVGTNRNDILDRFFRSGTMRIEGVVPTVSPSMDIQVSSNFERLFFELSDRDGEATAATMAEFRKTGAFSVSPSVLARARSLFSSHRLDDEGIARVIRDTLDRTGELIDPHTAVGVFAARQAMAEGEGPMVALACAHPAKFPDAVEAATGIRPPLPPRLADLLERPERTSVVPADLDEVKRRILAVSRVAKARAA